MRHAIAALAGVVAMALLLSVPASAQDDTTPSEDTSQQAPGVPLAFDPCQLVTAAEASSLSGANYTSSTYIDNADGGRTCVYGAQTLNVFMVTAAQAPDAATAQAAWSQEEASVQNALQKGLPPGVTVNFAISDVASVSGADRAAVGQFSATLPGGSLGGTACYLLKGPVFVGYSDLVANNPPPTTDAMQSEAPTVLGRLP